LANKSSELELPPVVDSPNVAEIFASEVVGTGVLGKLISINLACHRWVFPEDSQPKLARVVVARLILTGEATIQLAKHLAQLSQAKDAGGKAKDE
jgi:hypothetical protein